jgi:hypothetical protein
MTPSKENVREILDSGAVLKALQRGSRKAVRMHKLLGNPIVTWREGKVRILQPDEIKLDRPSEK